MKRLVPHRGCGPGQSKPAESAPSATGTPISIPRRTLGAALVHIAAVGTAPSIAPKNAGAPLPDVSVLKMLAAPAKGGESSVHVRGLFPGGALSQWHGGGRAVIHEPSPAGYPEEQ